MVTIPALLPTSISQNTIRRRTGWATISSGWLVVSPTPLIAARAWKRASSCDIPVSVGAMLAMRLTSIEAMTTTSRPRMAIIPSRFPPTEGTTRSWFADEPPAAARMIRAPQPVPRRPPGRRVREGGRP